MRRILRPILTKGEEYNEIPEKVKSNGPIDKRPIYDEAKKKLLEDIYYIENKVKTLSDKYIMDDIVLNLRMRIDSSAKSYHPVNFINESKFRQIGTKKWSEEIVNKKKKLVKKIGKSIFVLINRKDISNLRKTLENDSFGDVAKDNIRSIEKMYIDEHSEILNSFTDDWQKGRVEIILHPFFEEEDKMINQFKKLVFENGGDINSLKLKKYKKGPIFISMVADMNTIKGISPFNPLRAVHPLILRSVDEDNISKGNGVIPEISDNQYVPNITLGIFDGGVTSNHKKLKRYVTEYNLTSAPKDEKCIAHGNAVAGVALFGDLKNITANKLPVPTIKIDSFRVFPLKDPSGYDDLYEVIDYIENIVLERPDIKVFNLSFGPSGPIEDDIITRFTYSIDKLTKDGKRIFVIAVGNDGASPGNLSRIQAPADSVNNVSVGSYCYNTGNLIRASYSCIGDGREGSKIKPDVVEYGGDDKNRMHFISINGDTKVYGCGTSFSSPIVARKLTEIIGYSSIQSPLTAKTILIHTSEHPKNKPDKFLGNGVVKNSYLDMLECKENKVTVIYESTLLKTKRAILKIPFIRDLKYDGKVKITWTICVATNIDSSDSDDYTNMCIEDTFYPNSHKFRLSYPLIKNKTKVLHEIEDSAEMEHYKELGWHKPAMPISRSDSKSKYMTEQERREDFKWDTVVKRNSGNMMYKSIEDPYIVIHALSRDKENVVDDDKITYSAAVTIEYIKCNDDVYNKTILEYSKLAQANIINADELIIQSLNNNKKDTEA